MSMVALARLLNQRWREYCASLPDELDSIHLIKGNGLILEDEDNQIKEVSADEPLYFLLRQIFPNVEFHFARIEVYLLNPFGGDDIYYEIEIYDAGGQSLRNIGVH